MFINTQYLYVMNKLSYTVPILQIILNFQFQLKALGRRPVIFKNNKNKKQILNINNKTNKTILCFIFYK